MANREKRNVKKPIRFEDAATDEDDAVDEDDRPNLKKARKGPKKAAKVPRWPIVRIAEERLQADGTKEYLCVWGPTEASDGTVTHWPNSW